MKNKILKIAFCFMLFTALLITASFAIEINEAKEIKEDVKNYTSDIYIIGSTRFDANQIMTPTMAAKAGANQAKVNWLLNGDLSNVEIITYYYDSVIKEWHEIKEDTAKFRPLVDEKEIKELEDNLKIFFVENEEKRLKVPFSGAVEKDTINAELGNKVEYDNGVFYVPVTTSWFYFESDGKAYEIGTNIALNLDNENTEQGEENIAPEIYEYPIMSEIPENAAISVGNEYFEAKDFATAIEKAASGASSANLLKDITLNETIILDLKENSVHLFLNGHTINSSNVPVNESTGKSYAFILKSGTLDINGGTIRTKTVDGYRNILNEGANLYLNEVDLIGNYNVDTNSRNSTLPAYTSICNCELTAEFACVVGWTGATVNISNSTLVSDTYCISGNGTACNATFYVMDSTLESYNDVGVYMPSTEALHITNSTITGKSGIEAVAGTILINNSKISATGDYIKTFTKEGANGSWVEGSAIFVRVQSGYNDGGVLSVVLDETSTLSSKNGNGIRVYECSSSTAELGVNNVSINYNPANITVVTNVDKIKVEQLDDSHVDIITMAGEETIKYVNSEKQLVDAIADFNTMKITVNKDITLTKAIEITREVEIDLNNYTIDSSKVEKVDNLSYGFKVTGEGNLTVKNGTMKTAKDSGFMNINNLEASLTVDNVKFEGYYNIYTNYRESSTVGTTVITNSTFDAKHACIVGWKYADVTVKDSTLESLWYAVSGNGTCNDTVFNIIDSTLTSEEDVAIFMPSTKTLTLTDCSVTGYSGIEMVAGELMLNNTTVKATLDKYNGTEKDGDGSWIDGSAILVRVQTGYNNGGTISVTMDETSKLESANGYGIRVHETTGNTLETAVNIEYYQDNITVGEEKIISQELLTPTNVTPSITNLSVAQ